jgi:WD40 repeat protein
MKRLIIALLLITAVVYAEPTPGLLWRYDTGMPISDIAISSDGSKIVAAAGDYVYMLNRSGKLVWKVRLDTPPQSVAITEKGNVIAGDEESVYLFNTTGHEIWKKYIGDYIRDLSTGEGKIAAGSKTRKLYMLNEGGEFLWMRSLDSTVYRVDISSHKVAAVTTSGRVYVFDIQGEPLWQVNTNRFVEGLTIFGEDVISGTNYLTYWRNGKIIGYFIEKGGVTGLDANLEYLLAGFGDGYLYAVEYNRSLLWKYEIGSINGVSTSLDGNYFAVASGDEVLFLTPPDTIPPAVKIVTPKSESTVSGIVKISAEVDEDVSTIQVFIDGNYACGILPCNWDTSASTEGIHEIMVRAIDSGGNIGEDKIEVTVRRTQISNLTEQIEEKKEELEKKKEELEEKVEILPIVKTSSSRYRETLIKGIILVFLAIFLIGIIKRKKRRKYRFKRR